MSLLFIFHNFTSIVFSVYLYICYLNFNNVFSGDLLGKYIESKTLSFFFFFSKRIFIGKPLTSFARYNFCYDSSSFQST